MQQLLSKYGGMAAIAILWLSVGFSILLVRLDILGDLPVSYLGVYQQSQYIFNTGLILSASLLIVFVYYLDKRIQLTWAFKSVFIFGQLCQILVALTPYNAPTIVRPVHTVAGFSLAITLPLGIWLFSRTPHLPHPIRRSARVFFFVELVLFVLGIGWFVLAATGGALAEIVTALAFDSWIIVLSIQLNRSFRSVEPLR